MRVLRLDRGEGLLSHNAYVLAALRHGPKTRRELLNGAYAELGEGIEVHCRIADVRRRLKVGGEDIVCTRIPGGKRNETRYEIVRDAPVQLRLGENAA
jgi:hypothetical protein